MIYRHGYFLFILSCGHSRQPLCILNISFVLMLNVYIGTCNLQKHFAIVLCESSILYFVKKGFSNWTCVDCVFLSLLSLANCKAYKWWCLGQTKITTNPSLFLILYV